MGSETSNKGFVDSLEDVVEFMADELGIEVTAIRSSRNKHVTGEAVQYNGICSPVV